MRIWKEYGSNHSTQMLIISDNKKITLKEIDENFEKLEAEILKGMLLTTKGNTASKGNSVATIFFDPYIGEKVVGCIDPKKCEELRKEDRFVIKLNINEMTKDMLEDAEKHKGEISGYDTLETAIKRLKSVSYKVI